MPELSFEEQHAFVLKWFNLVIRGYLCGDIEKLVSIQPDKEGLGGCAAPLAMTVFATMDRLGYLTQEDDKETDSNKSERRIKAFCEDWMAKANKEVYTKSKTRDLLAEVFRHGFAHQFISPAGTVVVKRDVTGDVVGFDPVKELYTLEVDILANDLLDAIENHLSVYLENPNKEKLIRRVYSRLEAREQKDLKNLGSIRGRLEKKMAGDYEIPVIDLTLFTTEVSGTNTTQTTSTTIVDGAWATSITTDPRNIK